MPKISRVVLVYLAIVLAAGAWAAYVQVSPAYANREHLLPSIILYFVTLPTSLSMNSLVEQWPGVFLGPATQLGVLLSFGLVQAAILYLVLRGRKSD